MTIYTAGIPGVDQVGSPIPGLAAAMYQQMVDNSVPRTRSDWRAFLNARYPNDSLLASLADALLWFSGEST